MKDRARKDAWMLRCRWMGCGRIGIDDPTPLRDTSAPRNRLLVADRTGLPTTAHPPDKPTPRPPPAHPRPHHPSQTRPTHHLNIPSPPPEPGRCRQHVPFLLPNRPPSPPQRPNIPSSRSARYHPSTTHARNSRLTILKRAESIVLPNGRERNGDGYSKTSNTARALQAGAHRGVVSQRIRGTRQNADFWWVGVLHLWHKRGLWHPFQFQQPIQSIAIHYQTATLHLLALTG